MEMNRTNEAERWFRQAFYDLQAARWNLEGGFFSTVCFLAQQSGEKALKALLYAKGGRRQALFTHSLVEMVKAAQKLKVGGIDKLTTPARALDLHYIPSRYPNGLPGGYPHAFYDRQEAQMAIEAAERIMGFIEAYFIEAGLSQILPGND